MKKTSKPKPTFSLGTKMRIKIFDKDTGGLLSDRLVEQSTELNTGPQYSLPGPYTLEFNLTNQEDVTGMIEYINKLRGELPIAPKTAKKSSTAKKLNEMLNDKEPLLDLIKTVEAKAKTQEQLIAILREYNFMFVSQDIVQDIATPEQITLREKDVQAGYQYMVRRIKEAKDPAKDRFDWRLTFGIKIIGEQMQLVQVYLWGKRDHYIKLGWEKKNINFKKVEQFSSFPEPMTYDERKRWRLEHRKWDKATEGGKNPEKFETSKFYNRWKPYIKVY